jgi:hypothetical protein
LFFVNHRINMGKEDQKSPLPVTRPPFLLLLLLLYPLPHLLSHPNIHDLLWMFSPSTGSGRKRTIYVPSQLSDLRVIKKGLGNYSDAPSQYIQAFISVI